MSLRSGAAAILFLAVTTVFAQENAPASAQAPAPPAAPQMRQQPSPMRRWGHGGMSGKQSQPVTGPSLQQRVQELQSTLDKMHAALKRMQGKTAASTKDPMEKANLQMWELMVGQLDKQLQELKQAEASREDMEARRAAMYKQAEIKSQAAAHAAQQAMFPQQSTGAPAGQAAAPGSPAPAATQAPAPAAAPSTSTPQN